MALTYWKPEFFGWVLSLYAKAIWNRSSVVLEPNYSRVLSFDGPIYRQALEKQKYLLFHLL